MRTAALCSSLLIVSLGGMIGPGWCPWQWTRGRHYWYGHPHPHCHVDRNLDCKQDTGPTGQKLIQGPRTRASLQRGFEGNNDRRVDQMLHAFNRPPYDFYPLFGGWATGFSGGYPPAGDYDALGRNTEALEFYVYPTLIAFSLLIYR
jgi:hypothetical protein